MRNKTGGVARGSDFFHRPDVRNELVHLIERDHVLLLAPRRAGKTSLMYHLKDAPPSGWSVVYANVEAAASEAAFVAQLLCALRQEDFAGTVWTTLPDQVQRLLGRVGKVGAGPIVVELTQAIGDDWQDIGQTLARVMAKDLQLLLMIDEFPIFVQRLLMTDTADRARLFLDWFRKLRQSDEVHEAGARFLLAGSIGLDAVVTRAGLSATINDLHTFRLGPLGSHQANEFLLALSNGERCPLPDDVRTRFLDRINWPVPFHLQLLFSEVHRAHAFHEKPLTPELVDTCYEQLLGPDKRKHFSHWVERLEVEGPLEQVLTRALLEAMARDPLGITLAIVTQIRHTIAFEPGIEADALLWALQHDGYITRDGDRWRFVSSLLRDWWLRWQVAS